MAVQAQHPANILLNRNGQEKNDYSSQQQQQTGTLGLFDHQFHMPIAIANNCIFSSGVADSNSRKRWRDDRGRLVPSGYTYGLDGGMTGPTTVANQNGASQNLSFSIQSQQVPAHRQIDISQLHRSSFQPNISTGLRLSSEQNHTQLPNRQLPENFVATQWSPASLAMEDYAIHVKSQREELDQFLLAQTEELGRALAEKRQRHLRELLDMAESSLHRRFREKEAEMEKAGRRNAELEARASQLSVEAQIWQAKARAQEAAAASLQAQLQQAVQFSGGKEEGCGEEGQVEDAQSAYVDPERVATSSAGGAGTGNGRSSVPGCKACRRRVARVVILPCRHLCVCSECDKGIQACPVCLYSRQSSVEVVFC